MAELNGQKNRSYELKRLKAQCVAEENKRFVTSQKYRKQGSVEAALGNSGLKSAKGVVYFLIVSADDEQSKSLQEQFKSTKSYKKTVAFSTMESARDYIKNSRFAKNSIIILIWDVATDVQKAQQEHSVLEEMKKVDPCLEVMALAQNVQQIPTGAVDYNIAKTNDLFSKIIQNTTWSLREQDRIRKQVESKQFIKAAILIFVGFFVILFAIDFISGVMSENYRGVLGIVPIPQP